MRNYKIMLMLGAACIVPSQLYAQTAEANSDNGDIVVTANKREESLNKVGLTIAAISGEKLADRRVSSLQDLATLVPGLTYASSGNSTPILTLRGVGFNESSLGVYPTVSVYIDQAPLPFPVMAGHAAFDLQRVEVLKGPQGTLFGQNSTGGAINYIAAKPTKDFQAGVDVSYGRFNSLDGNAFISGPLTDRLGIRVSAQAHHMDDWQRSVSRPGETNGHQSYVAARTLLAWEATDSIDVSLNVNGWIDKSQPQAQQLIAVRPQVPANAAARYPVITFAPNNARAADWTSIYFDPASGQQNPVTGEPTPGTQVPEDISPRGNRRFVQLALRTDVRVSDDITLTNLISYDYFKRRDRLDSDGSIYAIQNLTHLDGHIKSFNEELRLSNGNSSSFRWIVGANFEHSKTFEYQETKYMHTSYGPDLFYFNNSSINNAQNIKNYAIFANTEWNFAPSLTLKIAGRYTNSKNKANICSFTVPGGNVDKLFNFLGGALGKVPFTPIGPSDCYSLNENLVPGFPFIRTLHEDNISWRAGLDYQLTPTTLAYANVSRGYKAGSFPSLSAALFVGLEPVTQEELTAYEAGFKTQLFDRKVSLNAAAFYYQYKDKQVRGRLADPVFGNLDALINIPKSRIWGLEADVTARLAPGLTVSGNVTHVNSKVTKFVGVNAIGQPNFDASGDPLPFTPKWSGTFDVDYKTQWGSGSPFVGFTVMAQSSQDAALSARRLDYANSLPNTTVRSGVGCVYCVGGYATVNARIGYAGPDDKWKITLWGKNIFNKYYWTNVIYGYDTASRLAGLPVTVGVTLATKLN